MVDDDGGIEKRRKQAMKTSWWALNIEVKYAGRKNQWATINHRGPSERPQATTRVRVHGSLLLVKDDSTGWIRRAFTYEITHGARELTPVGKPVVQRLLACFLPIASTEKNNFHCDALQMVEMFAKAKKNPSLSSGS